jgi:hypothetical protein
MEERNAPSIFVFFRCLCLVGPADWVSDVCERLQMLRMKAFRPALERDPALKNNAGYHWHRQMGEPSTLLKRLDQNTGSLVDLLFPFSALIHISLLPVSNSSDSYFFPACFRSVSCLFPVCFLYETFSYLILSYICRVLHLFVFHLLAWCFTSWLGVSPLGLVFHLLA